MVEREERLFTDRQLLLQIEDLHVATGMHGRLLPTVRGVNLQIHRGEVVALLGETDSGKSAVAQAIVRMIPPPGRITGGAIRLHRLAEGAHLAALDLVPLQENSREIRQIRGREISLLLHERVAGLAPTYPIINQVLEVMRLPRGTDKQAARQEAAALLRMVGISEPERYLDVRPAGLSASVRQRILMAIAVAAHPALLIADEPTRGLDVIMEAQILALLDKIQREREMAILLTTSDPNVAAALADRIAVMYSGHLIELAPRKELLVDPLHPYTRGLLQSAMNLGRETAQRLAPLSGTTPPLGAQIAGCPFHPRCPSFMARRCDAAMPALIEATRGHRVACYLYGSTQETVG